MIEKGTVHKTERGGYAVVRFDRKSSCDKCRMCTPSKDGMRVELRVKNGLLAKTGDTVLVEMSDKAVLVSSIIVYMVPILVIFAALMLTKGLHPLVSFAAAIGGAVVSLAVVAFVDRKLRDKKGYLPTMTAIIEKDAVPQTPAPDTDENDIPKENENEQECN